MKRAWLTLFTSAVILLAVPAVSYAATDNYISKTLKVGHETALEVSFAPNLVIEASISHTSPFSFSLHFDGAQWIGGETGNFAPGVAFRQIDENWIIVEVDTNIFDAQNEDIRIPMLVNVEGPGDVTVRIDGNNSSVSSGTYTIAYYIDGNVEISIKKANQISGTGLLQDITISDETHLMMEKNSRIRLTLDNGFTFSPASESASLTTTGKFNGNIDLSFSSDRKTAYLTIVSDTEKTTGKIVISGFRIIPSRNASYNSVKLTMTLPNGDDASLTVADYVKAEGESGAPVTKEIILQELDPYVTRPSITGRWQSGKILAAKIDAIDLGTVTVDKNGSFTFSYPKDENKLALGEHTLVLSEYLGPYTEPSYQFTQHFTLLGEYRNNNITMVIGSTEYSIGGIQKPLDAPAPFIDENGKTQLPLRAVANILGITDESIKWSPDERKVTVIKSPTEQFSIVVGEPFFKKQDGSRIEMESSAVIKDGSIFLPLRDTLHAFGISDKNILWNDSLKTVTIVREAMQVS